VLWRGSEGWLLSEAGPCPTALPQGEPGMPGQRNWVQPRLQTIRKVCGDEVSQKTSWEVSPQTRLRVRPGEGNQVKDSPMVPQKCQGRRAGLKSVCGLRFGLGGHGQTEGQLWLSWRPALLGHSSERG